MCLQYVVTHEDFLWATRGEPDVIGAFEKVYDTQDLLIASCVTILKFGFSKKVCAPTRIPSE
ncbi:hypothetical protein DOTSEDRAFT_43527 [Dothistroma septosporum NZE10]|uniref:Uncharacterized protein n=1 Tax=Dothistroma septosporum (strain NZE10 / CBS 128990) TaxID=675120 RepID=N1PP07_DOTSN|nr:hypothetical protein DOTSEDRAFT_43527 [Dothistroma septosporum NZE10]